MGRRKWWSWVVVCMVIVLLSGCIKEKPLLDELSEDGSGTLRVMYYDEESFQRQYGNYFSVKYPNMDIEVVSTKSFIDGDGGNGGTILTPSEIDQKLMSFIEKERPDIIYTNMDDLSKLVKQGKLYHMDPIIQQEGYSLDDMLPGLIAKLREKGDGGLYGLAPSFYTNVMFYNVDLFKQHNIQLPTNKMSWKQVLEIGEKFNQVGSGNERLYGLSGGQRDSYEILSIMMQTSNLQWFDARGEKIIIDTPAWRELFSTVAKAIDRELIWVPSTKENGRLDYSTPEDPFYNGKAAMTMDITYMIDQMDNMWTWPDRKLKPFAWNIVTMPIDPNYPNESPYVSTYDVFAINQDSPHKREAWELIKFIHSPDMAKVTSKMLAGDIPTRVTYLKDKDGVHIEALAQLGPRANNAQDRFEEIVREQRVSEDFKVNLKLRMKMALDAIIAGEPVDDILPALQQELQALWDQARKKGNKG
ncbi:ABC transporter substrate-binding protein [Paenibacillus agilis]|uniref:Extracellular solute-binding protein n=1 Tax=Paenibacillus agilis TaxID=3020863 RepID=A0A559IQ50_9BACL|nr:extracellular solute-binding protein [Paenibacillus agilis]TVX89720.1 extracellular solute-binding protein [Paenibacillus agilis]